MVDEIPTENDNTFKLVKEKLDASNINYRLIEHLPTKTSEESAEIRGTSLASGAKAMLLKTDLQASQYILAIISAKFRFSSKLMRKILKCKQLKFASPEEVKNITGCISGAVPPYGSIFRIPCYVDISLIEQGNEISYNAGLRTKSIVMSTEDWLNVENPIKACFREDD